MLYNANSMDNGSVECHAVNNDVLFKKLTSLKINKACDFDGHPPTLVKIGPPVLKNTLLQIVNQSITSCNVPSDLKMAEVFPIVKKDDRMIKEKYQPLVFCQLFPSLLNA